jgi:S-adenosylmethionine:tRNA ribosyltransferase-isomerase
MRVDAFDFDLPDELIALRPAEPRDSARLLVVEGDALGHRHVRDLPDLLRPGDALVFNDTRVIRARLEGERHRPGATGASVEAMLHRRVASDRWLAFARPGKRIARGDRIRFGANSDRACLLAGLDATVEEKGKGGEVLLRFDLGGPILEEAVAAIGHVPLPPYIASRRDDDERDRSDYQTVFARHEGAVAAPTAGLHFTPDLLERLAWMGVSHHFVTLHVGAGTFLPVKSETVEGHHMHAEWGEVTSEAAAALNAVRQAGGRIVAIGTTALRLLESAADEAGHIAPFSAETSIFITPGYRFRTADLLMTNFHLPRSTLMMLVSAFAGTERMRAAYAAAVKARYRFYSYGDACLLHRDPLSHRDPLAP